MWKQLLSMQVKMLGRRRELLQIQGSLISDQLIIRTKSPQNAPPLKTKITEIMQQFRDRSVTGLTKKNSENNIRFRDSLSILMYPVKTKNSRNKALEELKVNLNKYLMNARLFHIISGLSCRAKWSTA